MGRNAMWSVTACEYNRTGLLMGTIKEPSLFALHICFTSYIITFVA